MKHPQRLMLLTVALMLFSFSARAGSITEEQARAKAWNFLQTRHPLLVGKRLVAARTPSLRATTAPTHPGAPSPLYVFNVGEHDGFVIVAGDDRVRSILGYADSGSFDADHVPTALNEMLAIYARQIDMAVNGGFTASTVWPQHRTSGTVADVAPLLSTTWDQGDPYNAYCPTLGDQTALTGCVATAMAQIAYYHKYPTDQVPSLAAYTSATNKINVSAWGATTFDWDNMLPSYSGSYTNAQKTAVATLMRYCGQAAQMDYGFTSGAYNGDALYAFKEKLGYNAYADFRSAADYSTDGWEDIIYNEVHAGRPVYYSALNGDEGGAQCGGHAFVIDGYRADGNYFHVNWGWGGACNGYFNLFALDADAPESAPTATGWHYQMLAIVGLSPETVDKTHLTIDVATSGTLATLINNAANVQGCSPQDVESITVTGTINSDDLAALSDMCTGDYSLNTIDLGGASVEGNAIGSRMFNNREKLTTITLPVTLETICSNAFEGCPLTTVTFGSKLKTIEPWAIDVSNIRDMYCYFKAPITVYEWDPSLFNDIPADAVLHVPTGRENTFRNTFRWQDFPTIEGDLSITTPTFNISVNVATMGTFNEALQTAMTAARCTDPTDISRLTVTGSINHEDLDYMASCLGATLDALDLGAATVENNNWGEDAFWGCGFIELVLPEKLERYEGWTFMTGLRNLKTIHIPDHFFTFFTRMFTSCTSLESVTGGNGVTYVNGWDGQFFSDCPNLKSPVILNGYLLRLPMSTYGAYEVPVHATTLASWAMSGVGGLSALTLSECVTEIQNRVFSDDTNLKDIYFYAMEMPNTMDGTFDGFDRSACTLHVYEEMVEVFNSSDVWSPFNIVGDLGVMPNTSPINEADFADLCNLYNTLGGNSWRYTWMTNSNVQTASRWHGVTFDDDGFVTAIDLNDNGLSGDVSTLTFTGMTHLASLNLCNNYLTGDIMPLVASLPHGCSLNVEGQRLGYLGEFTLYEMCNYGGLPSIALYNSQSGTLASTLIGVGGYCQFLHEGTDGGQYWDCYIFADGSTWNNFKFYWPSPTIVECYYPHRFSFTYHYEMGDANMDDAFNVLDLQATLNYSNAQLGDLFNHYAADTYGPDDEINVQDIVTTVNMLLALDDESAPARMTASSNEDDRPAEACLSVENGQLVLYTSVPVAALDLRIDGIEPGQISWEVETMGFTTATAAYANGTHAIIYSVQSNTMEDGRTVLATFDASLCPHLASATLSNSHARTVSIGNSVPTSINDVEPSKVHFYYDLQGRRVNGKHKKGIYIENGKKVVIN